MNLKFNQRKKGQVFSIDVLFALLPMVMILGASLQYLYLAEEDMKVVVIDSEREMLMQAFSDAAMAEYFSLGEYDLDLYFCDDYDNKWRALYNDILKPVDYEYYAQVWSYNLDNYPPDLGERLCNDTLGDYKYTLFVQNNTMSSQERFMLEEDPSSAGDPNYGHIAGVSFAVWEDID